MSCSGNARTDVTVRLAVCKSSPHSSSYCSPCISAEISHWRGRCGLCVCRSKAELKLCREGGECLWKGSSCWGRLFLLAQTQARGDAAYPRTLTVCADVLESMGWTKAAFPVREGSFAEEVGFRAKRARAEESCGWFLAMFFQRRCWFNTSCCSVGFSSSQGRRVHGAEPLHDGV